ncbi:VanZ family protein [Ramlibacter sp. H39-3-26]|uniref:VanZ family protein n=1 Tax=Curvibacter soli TaxID=3031331 RepID=UPI0023DBB274|nr:VanZ family protein [Ramlibacter sp. H39-3-26]MDF1486474.1 VanZ family protein [Ramlibacter sp. H39-3-26]
MHKTSAWPLAFAYAALIAYASLYPFSGWRDQGIAPWAFLAAPWSPYWTGFDVFTNVLGYVPLGALLALALLRSGRARAAVPGAALAGALLALVLECLQSYLPARVPSNVDLALNAAGALGGALLAALLERLGAIDRWSRLRARWFVADAGGALALLALWPAALLFPAAVPFGLGQVLERLEDGLADLLEDTPFLEWLPIRDVELQPLVPLAELLCVMLGVLIPCLLAYGIARTWLRRVLCAAGVIGVGVAATTLSAALSYGPAHAWEWLDTPVRAGVWAALALAALCLPVPRRGCAALLLLALAVQLSMLNQSSADVYFAQTLQTWEQGRFIRFHGLGQWLGWVWPYAVLVYVLLRFSRRERDN